MICEMKGNTDDNVVLARRKGGKGCEEVGKVGNGNICSSIKNKNEVKKENCIFEYKCMKELGK